MQLYDLRKMKDVRDVFFYKGFQYYRHMDLFQLPERHYMRFALWNICWYQVPVGNIWNIAAR